MTSLIKNELFKIFHKKFIYILAILSLGLSIFVGFVSSKDFTFDALFLYEDSVNRLENDNLKDYSQEELEYLVADKNNYDSLKLIKEKKYKSFSWQASYIEGGIVFENISCMNRSKYITKNSEEYETCKREYEDNLKYLENNDWKHFVSERLDSNKAKLEELTELQKSLNNGTVVPSSESLENVEGEESTLVEQNPYEEYMSEQGQKALTDEINNLNYFIEVDEYRLKYEIEDGYSSNSMTLNQYAVIASEWDLTDKNEKNYKTAEALAEKRMKEKQYYETKYTIENGIFSHRTEGYENSLTVFTSTFSSTIFYLIILAIVLGATMVTEEFSKGTIKQMLLKPFTRSKLLVGKIIAASIVFLLFSLFYMVATYVVYGAFFGFADLQLPVVVYNFHLHKVVEYNAIIYALINYISILPVYIILFTLAFMVGNLFENTVLAIIVPMILYMFGDVVNIMIPKSLAKLRALLPTNCWNLNQFLFGGISSYEYETFTKSLCVDVVITIAFVIIAFVVFKKKDIKNQ